MSQQVKSKKRVNQHGEVFTAEREINIMLGTIDLNNLRKII